MKYPYLKFYSEVAQPTEDLTHLRVGVYYDKSGVNYGTYKKEPGGFWVTVTPVAITKDAFGTTERSMGFSGYKNLLEAAARYNKKRQSHWYNEVVRQIKDKDGIAWDIVSRLLSEKNATLKDA